MVIFYLRHSGVPKHGQGEGPGFSGRLKVRWPFAFPRIAPRLDPAPCGGSRGRGSHARRVPFEPVGAAASPIPHRPPDLQTPRSHQETWADAA